MINTTFWCWLWIYFLQIEEFGVTEARDLKPNGSNLIVTEENKAEYVHLVCQMKMTSAIRKQIDSFLEGFYDIIPKKLIGIFNEQELELLIAGLPTIDVDDLKANTEYHKYQSNSLQVTLESLLLCFFIIFSEVFVETCMSRMCYFCLYDMNKRENDLWKWNDSKYNRFLGSNFVVIIL